MKNRFRLEPTPGVKDIDEGLAARLHDPLWMLARQWQLGEFAGNDAGSPAYVHIDGSTAEIGAVASGVARKWRRYDRNELPLDALVESAEADTDLRTLLQAGAHFVRLLAQHKLSRYAAKFQEAHSLPLDKPRKGGETGELRDPLLAIQARTVPEPRSLESTLRALVAGRSKAVPFVSARDRRKVAAVAAEWLAWYKTELGCTESPSVGCWEPHRLEHHALIAASSGGKKTVLRAREYCAESLDWLDFEIDPQERPPRIALPKAKEVALHTIPTPIQYGGMPAARYWELEDGLVDFGSVEAGAHDPGRLLLIEFAMVFGNDWFLVPLRIPSGTMTQLDHVVVTNVFGEHQQIERAQDPTWDLFTLDVNGTEPHPAGAALLLPPALDLRVQSDPLETVHLLRDEMANIAWAVERRVADLEGMSVDRQEEWRAQRKLEEKKQPPVDREHPQYQVETTVPDHWLPLIPDPAHRLVLVPLVSGAGVSKPLGRLLTASARQKFWLYGEEVPRAGISIDRSRRYLRWYGGQSLRWVARTRRTGRGEGSSGLRFDVVVPD
jgi:hypothetical protein